MSAVAFLDEQFLEHHELCTSGPVTTLSRLSCLRPLPARTIFHAPIPHNGVDYVVAGVRLTYFDTAGELPLLKKQRMSLRCVRPPVSPSPV